MKKLSLCAVASLLFFFASTPARAQFGSGIVYDPTNYGNAVLRYQQLQQQYQQMVQEYQQLVTTYDLAKHQATPLGNLGQYNAQFSSWKPLGAANTYGNTSTWVSGSNSGNAGSINDGYYQVAPTAQPYGDLSQTDSHLSDQKKTQYGGVELSDGINITSLQTIGDIRSHSADLDDKLKQLEADALSTDDDQNTEAALLNKLNVSNILIARSQQDTNKLLLSLLEQTAKKSTDERNDQVQKINTGTRAIQYWDQTTNAMKGSGTVAPFKLP